VELVKAIAQNPLVPEGHYLILENPAVDASGGLAFPIAGNNSPTKLQTGRKIVIAGPMTFPLWPGQFAKAISGHHLRSNQYLVVRVYNGEQATKAAGTVGEKEGTALVNGQLFVIKGTEVPFFIPATGFEVLAENNNYVREALTLERLEYCILLAESGDKRFERGPQVVFPEATEQFMTKNGSKKFKAIELNDQMGLYIKVIAEYEVEDGVEAPEGTPDGGEFVYNGAKYLFQGDKVFSIAGEELFITGKDQRIYYPRAEHGLITYKDPKGNFERERYYGIAIPKGEGRYVLVKDIGDVETVNGPKIFLPDPRNQVIVRRVLDAKTVALWYPGNQEAIDYNENLRELLGESDDNYVADALVRSASIGTERGFNRNLKASKAIAASTPVPDSFEGDKMSRGTQFTPPPSITLNTKYDGVPTISPYVGYAVQVVNKSGDRRVVVGPDSILLAYDETLAVLELSTGKPKNTDSLLRAVYLRVDNNIVSDIVRAETKDLVNVDVKLSYRVNFLREHKDKWFSVENYVKFLCDHMRSRLKGAIKQLGVKEFIENSTAIVRDTVLGTKVEGETRSFTFAENGMSVYDVEVLGATISDDKIAGLLRNAQQTSVTTAINLSTEEAALEAKKRSTAIQTEVADLEHGLATHRLELASELEKAQAEQTMARLQEDIANFAAKMTAKVNEQDQLDAIAGAALARRKGEEDYTISLERQRVEHFESRMKAFAPGLIEAMNTLGNTEFATKLSTAIAPLALHEQMGLGTTMEKVFANTPFATILANLQSKPAKAGQ
jgi:major vault protein